MAARRVVSAIALVVSVSTVVLLAVASLVESASPVPPLFGASRFTRGRGLPDTFERSFTVPPWIVPPYTMRVQNGEPTGANRMVLAWIWINNQRVAAPSDFRHDRDGRFNEHYDRTTFADRDDDDEWEQQQMRLRRPPGDGIVVRDVSLQAVNRVRVRLSGRPDRYITVSITGTNGDRTAPQLSVVEPAGPDVMTSQVPVRLRYRDVAGAGEPAASGIVRTSIRVSVDSVDRTTTFATTASEASAVLSLTDGIHVIQARVSDMAGNVSTISNTFIVRTPPPVTCQYSVLPSTATMSADEGTERLVVAAEPECAWTTASGASWIAINDIADGYRGQVMADDPAGYWRFGERDTVTARDLSGHHLDGLVDGAVTQGVAGVTRDGDTATEFQSASVQFADGVPLLGASFSVEAWLQNPQLGTIAIGSGWTLTIEGGRVRFRAERNEIERFNVSSVRSLDDGAWHHLVAVYAPERQVVNLFVDGALDASGPTSEEPLHGGAFFMIGPLSATLDEVAAYRSALTTSQVTSHFDRRTSAGGGPGVVIYTVASNPSLESRAGAVTVAGSAVSIQQQGQTAPVDPGSGPPIQRPGLHYSVAAGLQHALALSDQGRVWSWGANATGQLGDGTVVNRSLPVAIPAPTLVVAIAAGDAHSVALKSDGTVWAWGANGFGQLGDGGVESRMSAVQVAGLTDVVAVAAGSEHSIALKSDGTVWAWGRNQAGQLGNGASSAQNVPSRVTAFPGRAVAVAATGTHTSVTDALGQFWEWGSGTFAPAQVAAGGQPSQMSGDPVSPADAVVVSTNGNGTSTIAVSSNGRVWTWGKNEAGQLGDGTLVSRPSPTQIADEGFLWHTGAPILTAGGTFNVEWVARGASATAGAVIHYTLSGVDPTEADPIMPAAPVGIPITQSVTLKAKAWATGKPPSGVASETYTLKAVSVSFNPTSGVFAAAQAVSLTTTTAGATIRYTVDGADPTASSPVYSSPLAVATRTTLKAAAFRNGWLPSAASSATYEFNFGALAPPVISPSGGAYPSGQTITLSAEPLATIRYTTDGSTPTLASSLYTSPLTLSGAMTVTAAAFRTDWTPSTVVSASFAVEARNTSCMFTVAPGGIAAAAIAATGELIVTASDESCGWTPAADVPWVSFQADANAGAYAQAVLADHPIGYWRLSEPAGAASASDASGFGRTASVSAGVTMGSAGALRDGSMAASFDGSRGEIVIPHDAGLNAGELTWEAWVNIPEVSTAPRRIFGKGSGGSEVFSLWIEGGSQRATVYYRASGRARESVLLAGTLVGAGWVHVAFAYGAEGWHAYVNGLEDRSGPAPGVLAATDRPIVLGRDDESASWYNGQIAEMAIYAYPLSAERIAQHAAQRDVMARGSGRVRYLLAANLASASRSGTLTVGGAHVPVAQAAVGGIAIAGITSTAPAGWTNSDATVSFVCGGQGAISCSEPVTLSNEGEHDVRGQVVDGMGNMESAVVHVRVDKTEPYVSVSYPSIGQLVEPGILTVRGTTIDLLSGLSGVTCNDAPAEVTGVEFTCSLSVQAAVSTVTVRAFDVASNVRETTLSVETEAAVTASPVKLRMTPQNVTMMAGEARRFSVLDDRGRIPAEAVWTIDNATVATLTTTPVVTLTAVSAGEVTLTATWRGLTATSHVIVVGAVAPVGATMWAAVPVTGSVERIVQGAVTLDNQRRVYALEHDDAAQQDLIRAFDVDGREVWATTLSGRVIQLSGDPFGGIAALHGTTITGFTAGGNGFPIGVDAGPGFAIDSRGAVYCVKSGVLVAGSGSLSLPPAQTTGGQVDAGIPTVLEDGRVAIPIHITNTGLTPDRIQLAVMSPEGVGTVQTVWESPAAVLVENGVWERPPADAVTLYKAVPNGRGDIFVTWSAIHKTLGSNNNPLSAYVGLVRGDGQPATYLSEVGEVWGIPGRYPFGDLVVTEDRVIATAYRLSDAHNEAVASQLNLAGFILSQDAWSRPEGEIPQFPTFLAAAGGGFIVSYPDGTMGGPDATFSQMVLAKAQYQGDRIWIGAANGALTAVVGPAAAEANSVWAQAQGSGQAANAAVRPGVGIFLKGQPVFLQYFHTSIRIVPRNIALWTQRRVEMFGASAKRLTESGEWIVRPPVDPFSNYFGTLGAESSLRGSQSCGGLLESNFNRERDVSALPVDFERVAYSPLREDQLIQQLLDLDSHYRDDLPYECFPDSGTNEYNSNSYVAGLFKAARLPAPFFPVRQSNWYPGWLKPLPEDSLK